jgi:hypothetical protein
LRRLACTFNILSLSMSYEQRIIIQFLHKEKVHPTQIHRRLAVQYGLETYSLRSVQHWCQFFDCGRQNLHDDPGSGIPAIDHLDAKTIACLEKESFSSTYSLAEALDVSPATVLGSLNNSLGMKNFHLHWVPHQLTHDLRQVSVAKCGELFARWRLCSEPVFTRLSQAMRAGLPRIPTRLTIVGLSR